MILAYCNPRCKIQIGLIRHPLQSRGRKQGKAMNDNENKLNQPTHPVVATGPSLNQIIEQQRLTNKIEKGKICWISKYSRPSKDGDVLGMRSQDRWTGLVQGGVRKQSNEKKTRIERKKGTLTRWTQGQDKMGQATGPCPGWSPGWDKQTNKRTAHMVPPPSC